MIVGAGSRGTAYAEFAAENPDVAKLVGVAEPREISRIRLEQQHQISADYLFSDWREAAAKDKFADAVVIATLDAMHTEPAIAFAKKGYHILLEKPMAPTMPECEQIVEAVRSNDLILAVGHVLLYSSYTKQLKALLDSGVIGNIVSIQHLEPVGFWHQAHSFVRGNWGNASNSAPMLLAKSCHDLDWIRHIVGHPCTAISSFGSLNHFRKEEKPIEAGEAKRCTDCAHEPDCCYSAKRIYLESLAAGNTDWPLDVVTTDTTIEGVMEAIENGPYGRCVYECDNDVVDSQVVNMEFANGVTVSFMMTAFTTAGPRRTAIFGTRGEIRGDGSNIIVNDFLTGETKTFSPEKAEGFKLGSRASGGNGLMKTFFAAVTSGDKSLLLSGPEETLESHRMVFAAEQARLDRNVVTLKCSKR